MPQVARCPHCNRLLQIPDELLGQPVRCTNCRKSFVVAAPKAPTALPPPETATPPAPSVSACPVCRAPLAADAVACSECGYQRAAVATLEVDAPANVCTNPACGVANPPGERFCQRCNTPLPASPGKVVTARFRLDKPLATGGFGIVYLATDLRLGQPVAVKEMIVGEGKEGELRRTFFRREAEVLHSLQALPIVPRLVDLVEDGSTVYLVLEYIPGQDLLQVLEGAGGRPFPVEQVAGWGARICEVLAHMHAQSPPLVHRDLKPDNVMLLPDRQTIRLIDFGTARELGKTGKDRRVARTKVFTEGYAPPEQVVGKPEPRSDLFALAGTLYHLATGRPPEGFFTARELWEGLRESPGPFPAEQRWFYELLAINLAEDPNDRYYSAREFQRDLLARRVTREAPCPRCGTSNPAREPFCRSCGEGLTDAGANCGQCSRLNRLGCRYCIYCGGRLR